MPAQSPQIIQAFNRWILTVMESLDNKLDIGSPVPEADKLSSAFGVQLTGDSTASGSTDGSTTLQLSIVHANTGIAAGEYAVLTVDSKGRAVSGRSLQAADVPTLNQNTTGNAATSSKWQAARNISMTGDGTWTVSVDGSANASGALTLANSGVVAGTYPKVTVDAKGRVTVGAPLAASDIPDHDTAKLTSGTLPINRGGTGGNTQATARAALGVGSMATRNVTISTAAPSGGADGDVWLQY